MNLLLFKLFQGEEKYRRKWRLNYLNQLVKSLNSIDAEALNPPDFWRALLSELNHTLENHKNTLKNLFELKNQLAPFVSKDYDFTTLDSKQ